MGIKNSSSTFQNRRNVPRKISVLLQRRAFRIFFLPLPEEGQSSTERPKSVYVYVSCATISRLCWFNRTDESRALTIPHGRQPMMMRSGVNLARHSLVSVEWPWLLPLSLARWLYRNWRSLPPPIRSMEAPVPRRVGKLCPPPPTAQTRRNTQYTGSVRLLLKNRNVSHR